MKISKYFWDLNKQALKETERILKNPAHPKFPGRLVTFLSRCQKPKELFSLISKKEFIEIWPKVKSYWIKIARESDFRDWWQTIYEQILEEYSLMQKIAEGKPSRLFLKLGKIIAKARLDMGLSQAELAFKVGMKQPDISKIEEGKKNITLGTLTRLCKVLGVKRVDLEQ